MDYDYNIPGYPINWKKYPPIKNYSHSNPVIQDLEQHMPANHQYRDRDLTTWAHETTHGLHGRLRNLGAGTGKVNAFYCLNDYYVIFPEPSVKISDTIPYVPNQYKNHRLYNLYMVQQQRYWNNEPLYIMDEWIAYTNGSLVGNNERIDSIESMIVFSFYATAMITAVNHLDSDYIKLVELKDFMLWQIGRVYKIGEKTRYSHLLDDLTETYFK